VNDVEIRRARREDVAAIVALLADDPLGAGREDPDALARYAAAFDVIDADPSELLVVGVDGATVVATMQLSFLPGMTRGATKRMQVEGVRVAGSHRGGGLGRRLLAWAIGRARQEGCGLVQLTSDRRRPDAHRFYEGLGFEATHVGFKLQL
jgi:GNAT superfamily N-acetyltransferase